VQSNQPTILSASRDGGNFQTYQRTQVALLKSRLVANAALRQPGVAQLGILEEQPDPANWLASAIKGDYNLAPEILSISIAGNRPGDLVILLDAFREAYLQEIVQKEQIDRSGRLDRLRKVLPGYEKTIAEKSAKLRKLAQTGTSNAELQAHKLRLERLDRAQKQLLQLQNELGIAVVGLAAEGAGEIARAKPAVPEAAVRQRLDQDEVVKRQLKEIAQAEQAIEDAKRLAARQPRIQKGAPDDFVDPVKPEGPNVPAWNPSRPPPRFTVDEKGKTHPNPAFRVWVKNGLWNKMGKEPDDATVDGVMRGKAPMPGAPPRAQEPPGEKEPSLVKLRAQLELAKKALAARYKELRPRVVRELEGKALDEYGNAVAQAKARVDLLKDLANAVAKDVDAMSAATPVINKGSLDVGSLQDELDQTRDVAKKISAEMETLKVELDAPSRVRVLEEAAVNADPSKKRLTMMGGAGVGALLLVVCGIPWLELRGRRISTAEQVKRVAAPLRLLGTLPALRISDASLADSSPRALRGVGQLLESVDATRTVLMHTVQGQQLKTVMVTSAIGGEGKTSLASHLAVSLARGGFNTLLVDGDLHRSALSRLFSLPESPGFGELLVGKATLADVIHSSDVPGLAIIPAGRCVGHRLPGWVGRNGRDVFHNLKARYDIVIVDSAPLLPVADSLLLAQYVDGVIFSILRDVSRMPALLAAYDRVNMLGIRIVGAVLAGVKADDHYSPARYSAYQDNKV
jgi:capsular exopolysaccharide synthesis family protein